MGGREEGMDGEKQTYIHRNGYNEKRERETHTHTHTQIEERRLSFSYFINYRKIF